MTSVVEVKSLKSFDEYLSKASDAAQLVCVFYWADFHEPSKRGGQMDSVYGILSKQNKGSMFLKVEADDDVMCELATTHGVSTVPTFLFFFRGEKLGSLEGANPPDLVKYLGRMKDLSSKRRSANSSSKAASSNASLDSALSQRLASLVRSSKVMLFMKGTPDNPRCKFSREMISVLNEGNVQYGSFDILSDNDVRQGLKVYSNHPTYPKLYVDGTLVGGLDDVKKLNAEKGDKDLSAAIASVAPKQPANPPTAPSASSKEALNARLSALVKSAKVLLFMKGSPAEPRCGFSRKIVSILQGENINFKSFDILEDNEVRQGLKTFSNWPTYPQLYVNGTLIGGLDIVQEMVEEAENGLAEELGISSVDLNTRLATLISQSPAVLFMKGNPEEPRCGFSRKAVALLQKAGIEFTTFDILSDNDVRQGLKTYSNWPTYPQFYVNGKLVGGLDILVEMEEDTDDLKADLGL